MPVVIMPVSTQHYTMLQRNLIYTGVTRGKSLVICVGTTKAMNIAVRNKVTGRRFSKLVEWLQAALPRQPAPVPRRAEADPFGIN
jgi:exodeoxyribonuclease V alpha subunit